MCMSVVLFTHLLRADEAGAVCVCVAPQFYVLLSLGRIFFVV